jgi:hypothetical protein
VEYELDKRIQGQDSLRIHGENDFRYRLPGLQDGATATFIGGDDVLGPLTFEARARPYLTSMTLKTHLSQTNESTETTFVSQDRDMSFKSQTRMELRCEADQPLQKADPGETNERVVSVDWESDRVFKLSWIHTKRTVIALEMVAKETNLASRKQLLTFGFQQDTAPEVSVTVEGLRDRITPYATIPVRILARDDQGLNDVKTNLQRSLLPDGKDAESIHSEILYSQTESTGEKAIERLVEVDLTPLGMKPMRYVLVGATASDQSHLGSQVTEGRRRLLRVVEPEQLAQEIRTRIEKVRGRLRTSLSSARETTDLLAAVEERSQIEELLRRHRNLEREVWSASRTLEASGREMELNKLIQAHAVEKLKLDVLEPLQSLHDQTLKEQRLELEDASSGRRNYDQKPVLARQEIIIKSLERILRNLSEWDSFVDFVAHLNEIIERQEALRRSTQDAKEGEHRD